MSTLTLDARLRPHDDVMFRNLEGEAVLVHLASGTYFGLDSVGTVIWEALESNEGSLRAALESVTSTFDVDEAQAGDDLLALAGSLIEAGLVKSD